MTSYSPKYIKIISTFLLITYSALFTLNIFHSHPLNLNNKSSIKVSNSAIYFNHFSNYTNSNCPVYNYFSSVHKINFQNQFNLIIDVPELILEKNLTFFFTEQQFFKSIHFRGPPTIVIS